MTILHAGEIGRLDPVSSALDTDELLLLRDGVLYKPTAQVLGLLFRNDRNITEISFSDSPYPLLITDEIILVDATDGEVVINLLPLATALNRVDMFKTDSSGFDVLYDGDGAELINGELTQRIKSKNDNHTIFPAITNWIVL